VKRHGTMARSRVPSDQCYVLLQSKNVVCFVVFFFSATELYSIIKAGCLYDVLLSVNSVMLSLYRVRAIIVLILCEFRHALVVESVR
jgi:hypothetical protein